jgi:hypothetical protein
MQLKFYAPEVSGGGMEWGVGWGGEEEVLLFSISIQAWGTSLTLTNFYHVIFCEKALFANHACGFCHWS